MNSSLRPITTLVRELAIRAAEEEAGYDYNVENPIQHAEALERELKLCADLKTIDLPPTVVKDFYETYHAKHLVCEGFKLTSRFVLDFIYDLWVIMKQGLCNLYCRFPHNFALVEDSNGFKASVIWIADMTLEETDDGDVQLHGHKFLTMQSSWENDTVSFSKFHSYIISNLDRVRMTWPSSQLIGKGNAFHLDVNKPHHPRRIDFDQKWAFHLLDHCISRS